MADLTLEENKFLPDHIYILPEEQAKLFKKLVQVDVNNHTEVKKTGGTELTYLSWAWAWQEFKTRCPDAGYKVRQFKDKDGVEHCYQYDHDLGYMVFTEVTVLGQTYEMWLPVMDGANKAMKDEAYEYTTKNGVKTVEAATMFDINKTLMRCLVKNLAMFGLGLYIYSGEDIPTEIGEPCTPQQVTRMRELKVNEENICRRFKVDKLEELTFKNAAFVIATKEKENESKGA